VIQSSLIKSVKNQERKAFKMMYEGCIAYVYTITKRYITNESDIPDVVQEIFARVFLSIKTFDESKGDFKSWLRRLVINQCFQHYRQGKSPRLHVALDATEEVGEEDNHYLDELSKEDIERSLCFTLWMSTLTKKLGNYWPSALKLPGPNCPEQKNG